MGSDKPFILHFGTREARYAPAVKRYADAYGLDTIHRARGESMFKVGDHLKNAAFCVIWNGKQNETALAKSICERRGIPHCFWEFGMLPQSHTWFIDPKGFCGDSVLNGDLSWVQASDRRRLAEAREQLRARYPVSDDGHVLVVLQVENDTQILHYSPWKDMNEFVAWVQAAWPNNKIKIKQHPKSSYSVNRNGPRPIGPNAVIEEQQDFLAAASRASVVVGNTSTCLYEAAILGKPVVALGEHPLRTHCTRVDDVLAGAMALRIGRAHGNFATVLERFHLRPLGCEPLAPEVLADLEETLECMKPQSTNRQDSSSEPTQCVRSPEAEPVVAAM